MPVLIDEPNVRLELTDAGVFFMRGRATGASGLEEVLALMQPHLEEHAPVLFLNDFSGVADLSLADRWKIASRMKDNRKFIRRSAMFGLSSAMQFAARVVLRASGRQDVRVFDSREEAEAWLLSD